MDIKVKGGQILSGEITPSGSKNSIVAFIPATILFKDTVTINNVPEISDVERLIKIMEKLGSQVVWDREKNSLTINNKNLKFEGLGEEDLGNMKGTSLLWGPLLARFGRVIFDQLPGGCTLGARPIDPHYDAFRKLGVAVKDSPNHLEMDLAHARAQEIWLTEMSPTVTENVVMLATALKGKTKIVGAASEPQVQDLCNFLVLCGAKIRGIGSSIIEIEGGHNLTPREYSILSDHYEITTFLAMAAVTGGGIRIKNAIPQHFHHINHVFSKFGIEITYDGETAILEKGQKIKIESCDEESKTLIVRAQPWPGLPVDVLPLFIPMALAAEKGQALFHNWMYEAGLFWTSEFLKMGANIVMCDPHRVIVTAGNRLRGAKIEAPYIIRAVVSLVMAAMAAKGDSLILNADALYRGHPHFAENLRKLGANIEEC